MVVSRVEEGDNGVGANLCWRGGRAVVGEGDILGEVAGVCYHRRNFFRSVEGVTQVAELDGGVAYGGGYRGKTLLLPTTRPALDLDRGCGELRGRKVGRDEETGVVVSVNQLDVVDRPSSFLAVLGQLEPDLVGAICRGAGNAVGAADLAPGVANPAGTAESDGSAFIPSVAISHETNHVVGDLECSGEGGRAVAGV